MSDTHVFLLDGWSKSVFTIYIIYIRRWQRASFSPLSKDLSLLRHLLEQLSPESLSYLCKGSSYICTKFYIQKILSNVKFPQTLEELLYYCVLMDCINILIWWMIGPSLSNVPTIVLLFWYLQLSHSITKRFHIIELKPIPKNSMLWFFWVS